MPPNVLLIVLDSVRVQNLSLYGHRRDTTPFLTAFGDEATVYTQARAPSAASLPSHTSIFTGEPVLSHGLDNSSHSSGEKVRPSATIWNDLRQDGYETACFSSNPYLTSLDVGLKDSFDSVYSSYVPYPDAPDPQEWVTDSGEPDYVGFARQAIRSRTPLRAVLNGIHAKRGVSQDAAGREFVDAFFQWVLDKSPWAACINLMDAHTPYQPGSEQQWSTEHHLELQDSINHYREDFLHGNRPWRILKEMENLYDDAIKSLDKTIAQLISGLKSQGLFDDTLIVITGDHGEAFGETDPLTDQMLASHTVGTHEVSLHVPLLVKYPGQSSGRQRSNLSSLMEFPTVVRAAVQGERESFEVDRVLSTTCPADENAHANLDVREFIHVLYEQDGGIAKHVVNEDGNYSVAIDGDPSISSMTLDTVLNKIPDESQDVSTQTDSTEISDNLKQRLAHLGYR